MVETSKVGDAKFAARRLPSRKMLLFLISNSFAGIFFDLYSGMYLNKNDNYY
jgi:hypothetical protein